jgi:putative oxidoreductase
MRRSRVDDAGEQTHEHLDDSIFRTGVEMRTNVSSVSTLPGVSTPKTSKIQVSLWIVQAILAAMFAMAGLMKTTMPMAELAQKLPWTADLPAALVRFIGGAELAGLLGLILPAATRILPQLTSWAAIGLVTILALAIPFHISRGEFEALPINLVLGGAALFVAWGRSKKALIKPRQRGTEGA